MAQLDPNNDKLLLSKVILTDSEGIDITTSNPLKAQLTDAGGVISAANPLESTIISSALPTGASTASLQTSGNSLLTEIKALQTSGAQVSQVRNADGVFSATNQLEVQIFGNENRPLQADPSTHVLDVIDYAHHEIHSGSHFLYTDFVELASGAVQDYLITTPDTTKWAHMLFDLSGSAITQFQFYEGADRTGTAAQTIGNSNRNSLTASTLAIHKGTSSGTTDGTQIHTYKGGSATAQSRDGSATRNDDEIILKQNTKYLLRVTSGTNGNLTNIRLAWYEHVDK